jgi:hypothetical protein
MTWLIVCLEHADAQVDARQRAFHLPYLGQLRAQFAGKTSATFDQS